MDANKTDDPDTEFSLQVPKFNFVLITVSMLPRDRPTTPGDGIRVLLFENDGRRWPRCLDRGQLYRNLAIGGRYFMYRIVPKLGMISVLSSCPSLQEVTGSMRLSPPFIKTFKGSRTRTAMLRVNYHLKLMFSR